MEHAQTWRSYNYIAGLRKSQAYAALLVFACAILRQNLARKRRCKERSSLCHFSCRPSTQGHAHTRHSLCHFSSRLSAYRIANLSACWKHGFSFPPRNLFRCRHSLCNALSSWLSSVRPIEERFDQFVRCALIATSERCTMRWGRPCNRPSQLPCEMTSWGCFYFCPCMPVSRKVHPREMF